MDRTSDNFANAELSEYETPFADTTMREEERSNEPTLYYPEQPSPELESPFATTFETQLEGQKATSPIAADVVNLLADLHSDEFGEHLYEMALELEDGWHSKISNETAMGERFIPFAMQEAAQYFEPVLNETTSMIDRVAQQFAGNNFADFTDSEVERFFETLEFDHSQLSPAQEQFFGSIFRKVKSVVSSGIDLAKKGISAIGKLLPIGYLLDKLKGLIKPLLDKVLKFAIGKLPAALRPYAENLAKRLLNFETSNESVTESNEIPTTGNLEAIQTEFDSQIANLVFSSGEMEAENVVMEYESSSEALQRQNLLYESSGLNLPSLDAARQQFINELRELQPGQSPAPAIERFLPVILALRPVIRIVMSIIGRDKIINYLAGLLAKLVQKYVPQAVAKPLSASIIDIGLTAIGFETNERNNTDLAYEAIANTIQETIQNMEIVNEETLNDHETLTAETLEAFEKAAANNFPSQYLKESKRLTSVHGSWVMMPRSEGRHRYKKFTRTFDVTLDKRIASSLFTFRGVPLANFLNDKLGLDLSKPVNARVHIYEGIVGTKLYMIARGERIPGLGTTGRFGYKQLHPLTVEAASLLLNEPKLGRDFPPQFTTRRHHTAIGQRFFYLEIPGTQLKLISVANTAHRHQRDTTTPVAGRLQIQKSITAVPNSSDIQGVINFTRGQIRINYYFSEQDAKAVAEKLNAKDFAGAFMSVKYSIRTVLLGILTHNIGSKVKIIHEAMPELFMENYSDNQEQFAMGSLGSVIRNSALNPARELIHNIIEKLINKISDVAYQTVINYFKARVNEFIAAQSAPQDGVTIKIIWVNVPGISGLSSVISALRGKLSVSNFAGMLMPKLPAPEVKVVAGKNFD
jgi:hypothetical protein